MCGWVGDFVVLLCCSTSSTYKRSTLST